MIKVGTDFSGVGACDQALMRLGIEYKTVFACDMDKFARESYVANYGHPEYYPTDVYEREIPTESLDLYVTSPPCQAFSLAGKRKGEDDKRGILFYNSHEFIQKNKPRYFIFENVKGLLSDESGRTFGTWIDMLAGKSVNGNPVIFPREDAVPYHVYFKVLNAKNYGVPQNRERIFIVGIRDDEDNSFNWPMEIPLEKRLKDVLENDVDEKYFLSDKMVDYLSNRSDNFNGGKINYKDENDVASCILKIGNVNPSGIGMNGDVFDENGVCPTLTTNKGEGLKIRSATQSGYETAQIGDSINLSQINSKTRRGRVGKEVAQTLDTACNQSVMIKPEYTGISVHPLSKKLEFTGFKDGNSPTLLATDFKAPKCVQFSDFRIRKLTPREVFRLMDFSENFKFVVSNSQLYKQAGNSIVVAVLASIIGKLKF